MEENFEHIESRVQQEMYNHQLDPAFIEDKLIDLKNRSRRNSLRVYSIKERPNKTWEKCKLELDTRLKEILGLEDEVGIERVHRVKTDKNKKVNRPIEIVYRILSYKDKFKILRNAKKRKGKNIFIN